MKKLGLCLSLCFLLFGCISGPGYERSTEMAKVNVNTWESMMDRIENDETFMFMITYEDCASCEYFIENVLSDYMDDHGFELNRVHFTQQLWADTMEDVKKFIIANPYAQEELNDAKIYDYTESDRQEGVLLTPTIYFIENGEVKDKLFSSNISAEDLDSMIIKYRLDEVK